MITDLFNKRLLTTPPVLFYKRGGGVSLFCPQSRNINDAFHGHPQDAGYYEAVAAGGLAVARAAAHVVAYAV